VRRIFLDTSAWDAIADGADAHHEIALLFRNEIAGQCQLITTNYVLDELYTLLLMNIGYQHSVSFKRRLDILIREGVLKIVWVSEDIAAESWEVFERFNIDKSWSFTDCTSYTVMKRHGLTEVFAFDQHFAQMGFMCRP
jgi:hypothetical protein